MSIKFANKMRLTQALLLLTAPWFVACVKGGSISGGSSATGSGTVGLDKIYPSSQGAAWTPITSGGTYYIKGLDLTITGTCSRGIDKIKVDEGSGLYTETATCDVNGNFSWNKTYTSGQQGLKNLTIAGYDLSDAAVSGASKTAQVIIDSTAPISPIVTTPGTSSYTYNGSSTTYTIYGTCASDTDKITFNSPTGPQATVSGTNWQHDVTLIEGANTLYKFYAHDLAGNVSAVTDQYISWAPSVSVLAYNIGVGGVSTHASGATLEGSIVATPGTAALFPVTGGYVKLETGFNIITHSARQP